MHVCCVIKTDLSVLYSEIVPVCVDLYGESRSGLCLQTVEFFNVKPGGTYCNQRTLKE